MTTMAEACAELQALADEWLRVRRIRNQLIEEVGDRQKATPAQIKQLDELAAADYAAMSRYMRGANQGWTA